MPITFDENMKLLDPIFRDNYDKAFNKLEKQLKKLYDNGNLSKEDDIKLTFVLGGILHTLKQLKFEKNYDNEILTKNIAEIVDTIYISK